MAKTSVQKIHQETISKLPKTALWGTVMIRRKRWLLIIGPAYLMGPADRKNLGLTIYDDRIIYIRWKMSDRLFLETLIHEIAHASHPDLNEEAITEASEACARIAIRFGVTISKT